MRSSQTADNDKTLDNEFTRGRDTGALSGAPEPGLVLTFSDGAPATDVIPLERGSIVIGRGEVGGVMLHDKRMSRHHARISFDGQIWYIEDLKSHNGSAADGEEIPSATTKTARKVARAGRSLFLLVPDVRPFRAGVVRSPEAVIGPTLQRSLVTIMRAARSDRVLLINGESGSGKELAARSYHNGGPAPAGPFVAVNAATLKPELSEAMLFGARKGFYSGAPGGPGFIQAAHGGTLFLDEIAELDASVQAKLLRVLEKREVTPLGKTKSEFVDFRFCSATHADLRAMVASGKMRADLYFRIATQSVTLPPLRERLEEIPWLIERAVKETESSLGALGVHVLFVEACLLRVWPGNVRELMAEVRNAAQLAVDDGGVLLAHHLNPRAGTADALQVGSEPPPVTPEERPRAAKAPRTAKAPRVANAPRAPSNKPSDEAIAEALKATQGNRAQAARLLGMHRTQLYRRLEARGDSGEGG
ncbi:MAG TPA: sigma 54-interacting transcriptional regulator [Polyangium sp.]|nr:sigma 54-interacting transcriptional regulator [Polyangium sp.]